MADLAKQAQGPMDRDGFIALVREFAESVESEPDAWDNGTLETFLGAMAGWVADMDGYYANRGEQTPLEPSWPLLAQMLLAGRTYE